MSDSSGHDAADVEKGRKQIVRSVRRDVSAVLRVWRVSRHKHNAKEANRGFLRATFCSCALRSIDFDMKPFSIISNCLPFTAYLNLGDLERVMLQRLQSHREIRGHAKIEDPRGGLPSDDSSCRCGVFCKAWHSTLLKRENPRILIKA